MKTKKIQDVAKNIFSKKRRVRVKDEQNIQNAPKRKEISIRNLSNEIIWDKYDQMGEWQNNLKMDFHKTKQGKNMKWNHEAYDRGLQWVLENTAIKLPGSMKCEEFLIILATVSSSGRFLIHEVH